MNDLMFPWLLKPWADLVQRHQKTGLPHALMFTGIAGIGKHHLALHCAQWLLCQQAQPKQLSSPCGQCHSCQLWQAGSHPDFMICQPEENSRQIRIDSVRKLNDFLSQTPQISHCQVVILKPVEVMNTNAANALLKTLEEPAGESFLLLEAERFGSVLPTIRSRCQRFQLQAPSHDAASQWLVAQGKDQEQVAAALRINPQAPAKAKAWLESDLGNQQQRWLNQFRQWSQASAALDATASAWAKLELDDVIQWFQTALADALKASLGVGGEQLVYGDLLPQLMSGAMLDIPKLVGLQRKVQDVQGSLLSGKASYNKQLLIESLLIDWRETIC